MEANVSLYIDGVSAASGNLSLSNIGDTQLQVDFGELQMGDTKLVLVAS